MTYQQEIDWYDVDIGDDIIVHLMPDGHSGLGGAVIAVGTDWMQLDCGEAHYKRIILRDDVHHVTVELPHPAEDCLQFHQGNCSGSVEWGGPPYGNGPLRCEHHMAERWESYENSIEKYAHSDVVPDWFDPTYAGERWDDD